MLSNLKSGATETGFRSLMLLDAVSVAYTARDWAMLRTLYHDEARLSTVAAHGRVVGPDELMIIFEELTRTPYSLGPASVVAIDDHAAIVTAPLRYPLEQGGIAHDEKTWLLTFKDELVYRSMAYDSQASARAAYAEHGISLGL